MYPFGKSLNRSPIEAVVMIARHEYLMLVGQRSKPFHEILHLLNNTLLAEVTGMNDDICHGKIFYLTVKAVGVGEVEESHFDGNPNNRVIGSLSCLFSYIV